LAAVANRKRKRAQVCGHYDTIIRRGLCNKCYQIIRNRIEREQAKGNSHVDWDYMERNDFCLPVGACKKKTVLDQRLDEAINNDRKQK